MEKNNAIGELNEEEKEVEGKLVTTLHLRKKK